MSRQWRRAVKREGCGIDCSLGRAVRVEPSDTLQFGRFQPALEVAQFGFLSACQHQAQRAWRQTTALPYLMCPLVPERGRQVGHGDLVRIQQVGEFSIRCDDVRRTQHQRRTAGKRRKNLHDRIVEAYRCELENPVATADTAQASMRVDKVDDVRVLEHRTLGLPGRTRGVDDVSQMPWCQSGSTRANVGLWIMRQRGQSFLVIEDHSRQRARDLVAATKPASVPRRACCPRVYS